MPRSGSAARIPRSSRRKYWKPYPRKGAKGAKAPPTCRPPLVDTQTAEKVRGSWGEEERRLIAAGWEPKERGGLVIWANPETGFYCSQEVALYRLEAREAARLPNVRDQKSARVMDSGRRSQMK